jgi:hypothetical protein
VATARVAPEPAAGAETRTIYRFPAALSVTVSRLQTSWTPGPGGPAVRAGWDNHDAPGGGRRWVLPALSPLGFRQLSGRLDQGVEGAGERQRPGQEEIGDERGDGFPAVVHRLADQVPATGRRWG